MAKFKNTIQQWIIRYGDKFLLVKNNKMEWIDNAENANKYASPYSAKTHLRSLTDQKIDVGYERVS